MKKGLSTRGGQQPPLPRVLNDNSDHDDCNDYDDYDGYSDYDYNDYEWVNNFLFCRYQKCSRCHSILLDIKDLAAKLSHTPGKHGALNKQISLALSVID